MIKVWKNVLILAAAIVSVPLIIILLIHFTPEPPVGKMAYARKTISMAGRSMAETYSNKLFGEAKNYYDSAMLIWQKENKRFIYSRKYERVELFADQSAIKANQAAENSISNTLNLKSKLKQQIDSLNNLVSEISEVFYTYPLASEIRNRISQGKLLLKEGEIAYNNGQYLQAYLKVNDSEYLLTFSYNSANEHLKTYFQSYSLWKKWIDTTISESRQNNDYSIIIDKFSRKCFVYLGGTIKYKFEAELGKNWVGFKRASGDMATPEGMYKITKKIEGNKTKYYKALLLNYPNDEDKKRFKSEIAKGSLPFSSNIGGMIEIHGNGGKGIDWTEGCIALTDKEMDLIYRIAKVGTPVTIVGSMMDLQYVINN
jgi:HEPN domain-containing protein